MPPQNHQVDMSVVENFDKSNSISVIEDVSNNSNRSDEQKIYEKQTFEDVLKQIGFGRVQIKLILIASLVLMCVFNETIAIAFLIPSAQCDLNLTTSDKGMLGGTTFLGILISSYFWGFIADTTGRRRVILLALSLSTTCTIISAFVKSFTIFLLCRFTSGLFMAGYAATIYAFVGEFMSDKNRASIISWVSTSIGLASIIDPLLCRWILSYDWSYELYDGYFFRPWRLLIIIFSLTGILSSLLILTVPESPKFYLEQNEKQKAMDVMRWMYRVNKRTKSLENFKVDEIETERSKVIGEYHKGIKAILYSLVNQTIPLLKPPHLLYFCSCSLLHFGTFAVSGGMAVFLPTVLNKLAKSTKEGDLNICDVMQKSDTNLTENSLNVVCDDSVDLSIFIDSSSMGIFFLFGFIALSSSIKTLGRRKIFIITLLTSSIAGFLLPLVTSHLLIIILYCTFIMTSGVNVSVINGAACDLFPTNLRAMAVCVTMMFGRLGNFGSANLIGIFLEENCQLTYQVFAGLMFVCLVVSFIIPDTRR